MTKQKEIKRPYFSKKVEELKIIYSENLTNDNILRDLKNELAHRNTPSAKELAKLVEKTLTEYSLPFPDTVKPGPTIEQGNLLDKKLEEKKLYEKIKNELREEEIQKQSDFIKSEMAQIENEIKKLLENRDLILKYIPPKTIDNKLWGTVTFLSSFIAICVIPISLSEMLDGRHDPYTKFLFWLGIVCACLAGYFWLKNEKEKKIIQRDHEEITHIEITIKNKEKEYQKLRDKLLKFLP